MFDMFGALATFNHGQAGGKNLNRLSFLFANLPDNEIKLEEIKPNLKTIVTSGYSSAAIVQHIHKSGTSVFVEKPYQLKDLLSIIREVLDNHQERT